VKIGSEHPIALQTMTTTDTRNIQATVDQVRVIMGHGASVHSISMLRGACRVSSGLCSRVGAKLTNRAAALQRAAVAHRFRRRV
jgi:4-hydroxy-3-methylbut-2-en-1-yl diphosphate synthase IspG/GcpE